MGFGVERDVERAIGLYKKAVTKYSNCVSQYFIGMKYLQGGDEVGRDVERAVEYLTLAAENGWSTAQFNLRLLYHMGCCGVKKDCSKAVFWYNKVAEKDEDP
jgi:TPR repeat protein